VTLPGSKSISNRVLLLAALATGTTRVQALLDSDDTRVMLEALRVLGVRVESLGDNDYAVEGVSGAVPTRAAKLFMGNAGTAIRPLTATLALQNGDYELSGVPRMHERPIGDLVDGLRQIGARVDYLGAEGFPPLRIGQAAVTIDQPIKVRGDVSSQFLTALLLSLPLASSSSGTIAVEVVGELISKPYVEITLNLLARFGIPIERHGWERFVIPAGAKYRTPGEIWVEGDASSASYFLAAGAVGGGPVRVLGVGRASIQGDVKFADALSQMGAVVRSGDDWLEVEAPAGGARLRGITIDCNHIPDAAMTLATAALFAEGETTLTDIASWRVKETDRIHAMATELRKLGATVEERSDAIRVAPPREWTAPAGGIDTYDDHRMAMAFAVAAFGPVPIVVNDPKCVAKTFPTFFETFRSVAS
jgi:3-phosphoshikimate 1-carboxyvinyltransferase